MATTKEIVGELIDINQQLESLEQRNDIDMDEHKLLEEKRVTLHRDVRTKIQNVDYFMMELNKKEHLIDAEVEALKDEIDRLELKLAEAIMGERPAIERGISFVKIVSVVAPLAGLLGTVTGMIITFQQITLFGTGDPKIMAGGISQALVTTVLGLVVAIPTTLAHSFLQSSARSVVDVLEEQATGIVAEKAK